MNIHIKNFLRMNYYSFLKTTDSVYDLVFKDNRNYVKLKKKSFGNKNKDTTFCIITPPNIALGTFAHWTVAAFKAIYAEQNGYVPLFDFKNYKSSFWVDNKWIDKNINWWDLYFKQYQYDLNEVYQSKNVYFIDKLISDHVWTFYSPLYKEQLQFYKNIYKKIGVREDLFSEAFSAQVPPNTCAIPIRRAMEWGNRLNRPLYLKYIGHHPRGKISSYIKWIENGLNNKKFDYFFIAVEDQETLNVFIKEFGNKCLFYKRKLLNFFHDDMPIPLDTKNNTSADEIARGYISETILLSKCDMIISTGTTAQGRIPVLMSEKDMKIIHEPLIVEAYTR